MAFNEAQAIDEIKKIYEETTEYEKDLQIEVMKLHEIYDAKRNEIYDKRQKLIEDIQAKNSKLLFWSTALRYACEDFDNDDDKAVLHFLKDLRHKTLSGDRVGSAQIVLEFYFAKNPFFENELLTKRYFINESVNQEAYRIVGCEIKWCDGEKLSTPFLNFFSPPEMVPPTDGRYFEIVRYLRHDLEVGCFLKEEVIPGAVHFCCREGPRMQRFSFCCILSDTKSNAEGSGETKTENE